MTLEKLLEERNIYLGFRQSVLSTPPDEDDVNRLILIDEMLDGIEARIRLKRKALSERHE